MDWETLLEHPTFQLRRSGRFLAVALKSRHRVLATVLQNGGQVDHLRFFVNHQSCEGTAHHARHKLIAEGGAERYAERVCREIGLPAESTAVMSTANTPSEIVLSRSGVALGSTVPPPIARR